MKDVGNIVINIDENNNKFIVFVTVADYYFEGILIFEGIVLYIDQEHVLNISEDKEYLYKAGSWVVANSANFDSLIGEVTLNKEGLVF